MNTALSLGGIVIALGILWANLRPWWKGGSRDPKALIPYGSGAVLGALSTICIGGLLGWGAAGIASLVTRVGDKGISSVAGTGSASVATGRMGALTPGGGAVVVLLLIGVVLLFKSAGKKDKRRIVGGFLTFAVLGILPGVAALLDFLPNAVNWAGGQGISVLSNPGSFL